MSRPLIDKAKLLLQQESGTIYKPLEGRIRFALAFPGTYRVGMSSLGVQIVYQLLNDLPGVVCERAFLPDSQDLQEFRRSSTRLFSLESQTPLAEFDVVAFSISFEMDYASVVEILELAGLPVFSADRDESHPLVIAGGPCATFNPEPLAEIIDAFAVGDAEGTVADLVAAIEASRDLDRNELLAKLSLVPGVYVPRFYEPVYAADGTVSEVKVTPPAPDHVSRRVTSDLDAYPNRAIIRTPESEFSDMLLVEAIRGCKRQCRFCSAGYIGLPYRPRDLGTFESGTRVGLVGSAVFDHPDALTICTELAESGCDFSVSSTRVESLTDELAGLMGRTGQRTFTIAPEAGTESLRRTINKGTTDEQVLEAARMAAEAGASRLKMYFMVGLPCETDEDIDAIAALAIRVSESQPKLQIQLSVSCYVPKPWTPFQWCGMATAKELSAQLNRVKKLVSKHRKIKMDSESPRTAHVQGWLARGDRRLGRVITAAARPGSSYLKAAEELGIDTAFYANRQRERSELLPWDHIQLGVKKDYLWNEFNRALEHKITSACSVGACKRCGVC